MMLLSYKLRRDLRLRRRIASLMAFCFVWFSCLGNLGHNHGGVGNSAKQQASKALASAATASDSTPQVSNNVQPLNASDHCAMCDWLNLAATPVHSTSISTTVSLTRMEVPAFSALPVSLRLAILGGRAPPTV